jgi:hypothetical protein
MFFAVYGFSPGTNLPRRSQASFAPWYKRGYCNLELRTYGEVLTWYNTLLERSCRAQYAVQPIKPYNDSLV